MVFSSPIFLFAFLPIVFIGYYTQFLLAGNRLRNIWLLTLSYVFYLFGAADFLLILIGATAVDYVLALLIERRRGARWWLTLSVTVNLLLLGGYKYANFAVAQINLGLAAAGQTPMAWEQITLPVGISFFTFQKLSYVIDVYRRKTPALTHFVDFALYVAMFPQLVAGPIVRYKDIWRQLGQRRESWDDVVYGIGRFCWGLAMKVMVADHCGRVADAVFSLRSGQLDTAAAWLGALAYTLQIYFDFAAYSDMAIGLARLFGFHLKENFNRPYTSASVTEFWRRWHISLSRWFRDYLYIPMGGNRRGPQRTYIHLIIVFALCGLWHGANWTFILWGLYHGLFLIIERATGLRHLPQNRWHPVRRGTTLIIVMVGWVLFRAEHISQAFDFLKAMFTWHRLPMDISLAMALNARNLLFLALGATALVVPRSWPSMATWLRINPRRAAAMATVMVAVLLPLCAVLVVGGSFHPFIYYRF